MEGLAARAPAGAAARRLVGAAGLDRREPRRRAAAPRSGRRASRTKRRRRSRRSSWTAGTWATRGNRSPSRGRSRADISGGAGWREALTTLAPRLSPAQPLWQPYYAPTLFQSLEAPRSADLRAVISPIFTSEMAVASRRGEALLSLFLENGVCRNDVALVLDVPGPGSGGAGGGAGALLRTGVRLRQLAAPERRRAGAPDAGRDALLSSVVRARAAGARADRRADVRPRPAAPGARTTTTPASSTTATSPDCRRARRSRRPGSGTCST